MTDELRKQLTEAVQAALPLDNEQDQGAVVNAVMVWVGLVLDVDKMDIDEARQERDELRDKLNEKWAQYDAINELLTAVIEERDAARAEVEAMRQELSNAQGENRRLRQRIDTLDSAQARYHMWYQLGQENIALLLTESGQHEQRAEKYHALLKARREQVRALQTRVAELESDYLRLWRSVNDAYVTANDSDEWIESSIETLSKLNHSIIAAITEHHHIARDAAKVAQQPASTDCAHCGGAGHDHNADGTPTARECPACRGVGFIVGPGGDVQCPLCLEKWANE